MIFFTLPNFYTNYKINAAICNYFNNKNNHKKMITPITFVACAGSYPYSYHNGSINNNQGQLLRYADYNKMAEKGGAFHGVAIRLDLSNIYLTENDFNDCMLNTILSTHHNGSVLLEVSSPALIDFISNKYPNFEYIFSSNADAIHPFTADLINSILENPQIQLLNLPNHLSHDIDFLKKLHPKSRVELNINTGCGACESCQQAQCKAHEQECQYFYSSKSPIAECQKRYNYNTSKATIISIQDIQNTYYPLGFNHYRLCDFVTSKQEEINFIFFIVDYFIKPDYREEVIYRLIQEANL